MQRLCRYHSIALSDAHAISVSLMSILKLLLMWCSGRTYIRLSTLRPTFAKLDDGDAAVVRSPVPRVFFYEGTVKVCHARFSGFLGSDQTASRLPFTKGSIPKPESHNAGNETHEVGIEYSAEALHGDAILGNHHPGDRPVDG